MFVAFGYAVLAFIRAGTILLPAYEKPSDLSGISAQLDELRKQEAQAESYYRSSYHFVPISEARTPEDVIGLPRPDPAARERYIQIQDEVLGLESQISAEHQRQQYRQRARDQFLIGYMYLAIGIALVSLALFAAKDLFRGSTPKDN
jgi:hypothetical protein